MNFMGMAGEDNLHGTNGDDTFDLTLGGDDTANGRNGFDVFEFGGTLTARDAIDGGGGEADMIILTGDYSAGLTLGSHTLTNIETLSLGSGFGYNFTFSDGVVAAGKQMLIDGGSLLSSDFLVVHAEAETNGNYFVLGGAGGDLLATGAGNDTLSGGDSANSLRPGFGNDTVYAGTGDDVIDLSGTGAFDAGDSIDGGDGFDTVLLNGDYATAFAIQSSMMMNVEKLLLYPGNDYNLDLNHLNAPPVGYFLVDGSVLGAGGTLTVDASQLTAYDRLMFQGSAADDVLTGGAHTDTIFGGLGADTMRGGGGADEFGYASATESTGSAFDTIVGFNADQDFIRTDDPGGVDPTVTVGRLREGHFDDDLSKDIGKRELHAGHAVLFKPSQGTYDGELFLIVERGGGAGYQAGQDLVIRLDAARHMVDFGLANFGGVDA